MMLHSMLKLAMDLAIITNLKNEPRDKLICRIPGLPILISSLLEHFLNGSENSR